MSWQTFTVTDKHIYLGLQVATPEASLPLPLDPLWQLTATRTNRRPFYSTFALPPQGLLRRSDTSRLSVSIWTEKIWQQSSCLDLKVNESMLNIKSPPKNDMCTCTATNDRINCLIMHDSELLVSLA